MRYMGDSLGLELTASMDPAIKAHLIEAARSMPDDRASDLQDVCDATKYGEKTKLIRLAIGAAGGLVVGVVLSKVFRR